MKPIMGVVLTLLLGCAAKQPFDGVPRVRGNSDSERCITDTGIPCTAADIPDSAADISYSGGAAEISDSVEDEDGPPCSYDAINPCGSLSNMNTAEKYKAAAERYKARRSSPPATVSNPSERDDACLDDASIPCESGSIIPKKEYMTRAQIEARSIEKNGGSSVTLGMSKDEVISRWWKPARVMDSNGILGSTSMWIYESGGETNYLYFENNSLVNFQQYKKY